MVICYSRLTSTVTEDFKREIKALIPGEKRVVLDLGQVSYMDSSGLGALVGLYVSAKTAGCTLNW